MTNPPLKSRIQDRLWSVVGAHASIVSATLTGSFLEADGLEGISDIDFVVIVDELHAARFQQLTDAFDAALRPELEAAGYRLRINPTLGPLKFNEPNLAVLHLMLYSQAAHIEHAFNSPFTCLDWQRSPAFRKQSLAAVCPVMGLQPRHFMSSRRSLHDYLRDFSASVVSYRELVCTETGYREERRTLPMSVRDRHEFAYHVLKFLMQNLLKLVTRQNKAVAGDVLLSEFFRRFPQGEVEFSNLFRTLRDKKLRGDFAEPVPHLDEQMQAFVSTFAEQFRATFVTGATRHVVFRHAATAANHGPVSFLGHSDPKIEPVDAAQFESLAAAVGEINPQATFVSPLLRCRQSMSGLAERATVPEGKGDGRLLEMDYGHADGLTVFEARAKFPQLFVAWERGEDPRFPNGECTADVRARALSFVDHRWKHDGGDTVTCTHNVVLRCLVGETLGVSQRDWHRLQIPHLAPFTFIRTREHGLFLDVPEQIERHVFQHFAAASVNAARAAQLPKVA